jgi:hypothetical protein
VSSGGRTVPWVASIDRSGRVQQRQSMNCRQCGTFPQGDHGPNGDARVVFLGRAGTPDLRVHFRSADQLDALTHITFGSVHGFSLYISRPMAAAAARMLT